jgi:hypothetical protein
MVDIALLQSVIYIAGALGVYVTRTSTNVIAGKIRKKYGL